MSRAALTAVVVAVVSAGLAFVFAAGGDHDRAETAMPPSPEGLVGVFPGGLPDVPEPALAGLGIALNQDGLRRAWEHFGLREPVPLLSDGEAAILASTAGSIGCRPAPAPLVTGADGTIAIRRVGLVGVDGRGNDTKFVSDEEAGGRNLVGCLDDLGSWTIVFRAPHETVADAPKATVLGRRVSQPRVFD